MSRPGSEYGELVEVYITSEEVTRLNGLLDDEDWWAELLGYKPDQRSDDRRRVELLGSFITEELLRWCRERKTGR